MDELSSKLDYQSLGGAPELVRVFQCSPCRLTLVAPARFAAHLEQRSNFLDTVRADIRSLPDPDIVSRFCIMAAEKNAVISTLSSSGSDVFFHLADENSRVEQTDLLRVWSKVFLLTSAIDKYFFALAWLVERHTDIAENKSVQAIEPSEHMLRTWTELCTQLYLGSAEFNAAEPITPLVVANALLGCITSLPSDMRFEVHHDAVRNLTSFIEVEAPRTDHFLQRVVENDSLSTGVTDSALKLILFYGDTSILEIRGITELDLSFGPFGNTELAKLAFLPDLQRLTLTGTAINSDGLESLRWLSKLKALCLRNTLTHDYGLRHLTKCALHELDLSGTSVTDSGVESLGKMARLRKLDLRETDVTAQGIVRLREKLPDCDIVSNLQEVT